MKDWQAFYGTRSWKDCRESYKKKARGLCELCLKEGRYTSGAIVHHKIELTPENVNDPSIALNFENLVLLCREHHAQVHNGTSRRYDIDELGRVTARG